VCLMHMQGEPRTMQESPHYNEVVAEVTDFLVRERAACLQAGVARESIAFDPGFGFGKSLEHNLTLLKELPRFAALEAPLIVGVSRKSVLGKILGKDVHERLYGGLGLAAWAVGAGANIIRTHDVAATCDAVAAVSAVMQGIKS
jgi:dihydropteroate synthase